MTTRFHLPWKLTDFGILLPALPCTIEGKCEKTW